MTTEEHVLTRRYIRTETPVLPFMWRGLLPLLALVLLFGYSCSRFAYNDIERAVKAATLATLHEKGIDWLDVSVDGQNVALQGTAPAGFVLGGATDKSGQQAALVALIKSATCATWAGPQPCAADVTVELLASTVGTKTPVGDGADKPQWLDVNASLTDGMLILRGEVPDDNIKRLLGDLATSKADPPRIRGVQNDLEVVEKRAPAASITLAERAIDIVAQFDRGTAGSQGGVFSARGNIAEAKRDAVKAAASAPIAGARIGTVELFAAEAVEACEKGLADLMQSASIKFSTASATIDATSNALLDQVAAAAKRCPGILQIEGHTDATGSADTNTTLSQARADAVKAALTTRGLNAHTLVARGFGANRPAASNDTDLGRAKNRRIEFHVVHASGQ